MDLDFLLRIGMCIGVVSVIIAIGRYIVAIVN